MADIDNINLNGTRYNIADSPLRRQVNILENNVVMLGDSYLVKSGDFCLIHDEYGGDYIETVIGTFSAQVPITTPYGSCYFGDYTLTLPTATRLTNVSYVNVSVAISGVLATATVHEYDGSHIKFYVWSPQKIDNASCLFSIQMKYFAN